MANPNTPILNYLDTIGFDTNMTRGLLRQPASDYAVYESEPILRQATPPNFVNIASPTPRPNRPTQMDNTSTQYRDMGHVTAFNQPRQVDIATPMPRPSMEERQRAAGVLAQPTNRRDNTILATPKRPDMAIGLGDALMSIGGAGLRGASEGGLSSLGGMFQQKDAIDEVNRSAALEDYNAQIAQQNADKEAKLAQQKADDLRKYREEYLNIQRDRNTGTASSSKEQAKVQERIGQIDETLFDMARAKETLAQGGVTGFFDGFLMKPIDTLFGNKDEVTRMLLSKLRVDDALLRIAQTKGAISNKEMDLFLSPAPNDMKQENVWIAWIEQREDALRNVRRRLSSGDTVENPASEAQVDRFSSTPTTSGSAPQGDISLDPDDQALLNKYPQ